MSMIPLEFEINSIVCFAAPTNQPPHHYFNLPTPFLS